MLGDSRGGAHEIHTPLGSVRALITFGNVHYHNDSSLLIANRFPDDCDRRIAVIESHVIDKLHQSIRIIDTDQPFLVIHVEDELPSIRVRKRDEGGCQVICSNGPLLELRVDIFPGLNSSDELRQVHSARLLRTGDTPAAGRGALIPLKYVNTLG